MDPTFYDRLAPHYHLLYPDWEGSIERQGAALAALLEDVGVLPGDPVLDVACGIGTQTIGLLRRGYRVAASDLSAGAVERARAELRARGLDAPVTVADMRDLTPAPNTPPAARAAAVLACDNAVSHLLSDAEIMATFRCWHDALRPGGAAIVSIRDYATIARQSPDVRPYGLRADGDERRMAVQVWEWEDDDVYDMRLYLTDEHPIGTCSTEVLHSRHYAVTVARLLELVRAAGFARVERRDGVLFQPVVVGIRR